MAIRTPTEIYVGADSRITRVSLGGTVTYEQQCKIGQVGNIFFTAAGPYGRRAIPVDDPKSEVDIKSSLTQARALGGTIKQIIDKFADLYADSLARHLQNIFNRSPKTKVFSPSVHVYLFAFDGDTPVLFRRTFNHEATDVTGTRTQILEYDCPPGCNEPHILGVGYGETISKFSVDPSETRSPAEVIRETIETAVIADPNHQSSLPVDILYIKKDEARWVQKKQECPEIQSY